MFPFIEMAGVKISMTALGIIVALLTFIGTTYYLCKKNHQDFFKLFYRLPLRIIFVCLLGRYTMVVLETSSFIPTSFAQLLTILHPKQFNFHFVGILIALVISLGTFFATIKRTENKKIRADILFSGICNAMIILGIFLTLGDTFIGKPTDSIFAIKTLHPESELTKFDGVYPVGLFLSIGALVVSIIINFLKIFLKKNWLGMYGLLGLLLIINICFFFQSYPRHGLIPFLGTVRDVKQYLSLFILIIGSITIIKRNRKRFY